MVKNQEEFMDYGVYACISLSYYKSVNMSQ